MNTKQKNTRNRQLSQTSVSKCVKCVHLITREHSQWGKSYTCAKNWYGGCSQPCSYGIRLCSETKDFKLVKDRNQLELF